MSFQKLKTKSYCGGQKHYSGTENIVGEITFDRKTGREINLSVGQCSISIRKKSMIVSDNTVEAEGLGDFFKNPGEKGLNVSKKLSKIVLSNPTRALDITANLVNAAASIKPLKGIIIITRGDQFLSFGQRLLPGKICFTFLSDKWLHQQ